MDDNRAVAPVIGVVILFGFLILALSLYQVEVVPQQNAETEFQHSGEVRNDLVELRAGILQAGSIDQPQYQTVQLGTTYSTRVFAINPPPPTGTIRTVESPPITISNESGTPEGTITIPTRFVEYRPGYNELDRSPTWYDASVLYVDARDEGGGLAVIEDQTLVDDGEVQITALQNEFRRSGTERVTLELRPAENVTGNIPEDDLTVTIPTRLDADDWKTKTDLPTDSDVYDGVGDTGVDINNRNIYNLRLNTNANNLTVDTVGVQEAPEEPTQNENARIGGPIEQDDGPTSQNTPPTVDTFQTTDTSKTGGNPKYARFDVDWAVSDDSQVQSLELTMTRVSSGNEVDSATPSVSGTSANGVTTLRGPNQSPNPSGQQYDITITVTDDDGATSSQTQRVTV